MREEYKRMNKLSREISKLKRRVLDLEKENAELKNVSWIYESPDGGETVYRRKSKDWSHRELIKSPSDDKDQLNIFDD